MHIANTDVAYLAFEGGGGKGVTYVGALKALEELGVLPIDIEKPGQNQIKGISGGSAGAIVALLVAMGIRSTDLIKILANPATFERFFDGPLIGQSRMVNRHNQPAQKVNPSPTLNPEIAFLPPVLTVLIKVGVFCPKNSLLVKRLSAYPEGYLHNLLYDRGLFPGFAMRTFLSRQIDLLLRQKLAETRSSTTGANLSFELFFKMTGVDLVVTGSNLTKHRPGVFSRRHTPKFPVAEAVGLSSSYPVFKPVYVEADVPVGGPNARADDYHGFWADGGLSNNFPLHAFDYLQPPVSTNYPSFRPLHPHMLGLRLTEGPPGHIQSSSKKVGTFSVFARHAGDLINTMLYPSEPGQIRSPEEEEQTIDLFTYDLETLDFSPPLEKRKVPIDAAADAVHSYFRAKK